MNALDTGISSGLVLRAALAQRDAASLGSEGVGEQRPMSSSPGAGRQLRALLFSGPAAEDGRSPSQLTDAALLCSP